jgi:hypothetical protein
MASSVGLGLGIAGGITQIASQIQAARVARKTLQFNAEVAERNAEHAALGIERDILLTQIAGEREAQALVFDLETFDRISRSALSATRAAIGASGTEFSGSNLLVAIAQAEELATQRSLITFASEEQQRVLEDQEALLTFEAGEVRQAGALQQGLLRKQGRDIQRALPLTLAATALGTASAVNRARHITQLLHLRGVQPGAAQPGAVPAPQPGAGGP